MSTSCAKDSKNATNTAELSSKKRGRKPSASSKDKSSTSSSAKEPKEKERYKVLNSRAYSRSLINRGRLDLHIDDKLYRHWIYEGARKPGGAILYSDDVITFGLIIRKLYKLPYRQTQGFLKSLMSLLGWAVPVPTYSTLSRRAAKLQVDISTGVDASEAMYISMDSTGLKVSGEGEWKMKKHGKGKRRTWRKLHVLMDLSTYEVLEVVLTPNSVDDGAVVGELFSTGKGCKACSCYADGAYDQELVRKLLAELGISQVIPPQRGAVLHPEQPHMKERDQAIVAIAEDNEKRTQWKQDIGYHQRSLVEVEMFRLKSIFTDKLLSLKMPYQQTEVRIAARILNIFTALGMPISVKVDRQKREKQKEQKLMLKEQQQKNNKK